MVSHNSLTDVMCYVMSGSKGLTLVVSKLHHEKFIAKQGASKSVKIFQQMVKLCQKLKWLFFLDTAY